MRARSHGIQPNLDLIKTKQDPLPYTMHTLTPEEKVCDFCGPPFKKMPAERMLFNPMCSFECGKRYVVEVLARPFGFNVIHGSTVGSAAEGTVLAATLLMTWQHIEHFSFIVSMAVPQCQSMTRVSPLSHGEKRVSSVITVHGESTSMHLRTPLAKE